MTGDIQKDLQSLANILEMIYPDTPGGPKPNLMVQVLKAVVSSPLTADVLVYLEDKFVNPTPKGA